MRDEQLWVPAPRSGRTDLPRRAAHPRRDGTRAASRFKLNTQARAAAVHGATGARDARVPVVLVSASQRLRDEVGRIAAAAGIDLEVLTDISMAFGRGPEVVLLGSDLSAEGLPGQWRHPGPGLQGPETILVGTEEDTGLWQDAARLEAARVAVLPAASGWLAEYLSRRRGQASGFVLGVVGGSGGAGASTLSCWLAHEAAEQGVGTLLVDGDPCGGGLDASLGSGELPGVRWPDLADVRGSLNPVQLISALPQVSGFALLSGGSNADPANTGEGSASFPGGTFDEDPAPESIRAVMDAARAAFSLTVVDCPRHRTGQLLLSCDALLLVVPGRLRPLLAARSLSRSLGVAVPQSAMIRGPLGDGLDDDRAANAVGLPLAGYLPAARNLEHAESRGLLLERGRRRSIRRVTGQLVERLASEFSETAGTSMGPLS